MQNRRDDPEQNGGKDATVIAIGGQCNAKTAKVGGKDFARQRRTARDRPFVIRRLGPQTFAQQPRGQQQ